jgi:hypothetical protein
MNYLDLFNAPAVEYQPYFNGPMAEPQLPLQDQALTNDTKSTTDNSDQFVKPEKPKALFNCGCADHQYTSSDLE